MPAAVSCTTCQRPLRVPDDALGRLVRCPLCLDEFLAQADPKAEAAARAATPPASQRAAPPPLPVAADADPAPTAIAEAADEPAVVEPVEEVRPVSPAPRKAAPQRALVFPVMITRDPDRVLRGRMDGELTAEGLYLRKPRMSPAFAAAGGRARYLGGNRLMVTVEGREVELAVVKPRTSTHHLAKDTAAFLSGKGNFPESRVYALPWYLYAIPPLFIALPFAAAPFGLITDGCLGAFLWTVIAAALGGLALAVVLQSWLKPRARLIGAASLLGVGAVLPLIAIPLTPSYTVDPALWKTYTSPDGDFTVLMPGAPTTSTSGANFLMANRSSQKYLVHVADPDVEFAVFVTPAQQANPNPMPAWAQNTQDIEGAKALLQQDYGSNGFGYMTWQGFDRATYQNGQNWTEVTYRVNPARNSQNKGTRTLVARIAVVNGTIYTLAAIGPRVRSDGADVVKFFDSIRLTGAGKTQAPDVFKKMGEPNPNPAGGPASPNDLPGGPAAYWSFDQNVVNGPVLDDTGNVTGTAHQTRFAPDGKRHGAIHFDGRNRYFDFNTADGLNFDDGDEFTFCAWVRTRLLQGTVLSNRKERDGSPVIDVVIQNGALNAQVRQDGNEFAPVASLRGRPVADGAWHHFALVRDRAMLLLYVDGVRQSQVNLVGSNAGGAITTNLHTLGAEPAWQKAGMGGADFTGDIDEFCIFGRALDPDEVKQLAGMAGP